MPFLLLIFLLFSSFCQANPADGFEKLAAHSHWHRLLHYKEDRFGVGVTSQVDGSGFFFAKDGKTDPLAELKATVAAFSQDIKIGKKDLHPQCAFPERYAFLKKSLNLKIVDVPCPELEEFIGIFDPQSISLIFSTAYPNNPGSMFGHTFLRINSRGERNRAELLDHGLSFAAYVPQGHGGVVFAMMGLFGGYRGLFSTMPYYAKVNEYNHAESRDLWEYELALNREETISLLRHAWEIETNSYFDYWFFDENCAYHLLGLIEVVKPEWKLTKANPFWMLPADTVKELNRIPGAIRRVTFRPSLKHQLMQRYLALNGDQRQQVQSILNEKDVRQHDDPAALETVAYYLNYKKAAEKPDEEKRQLEFEVLQRRSQLPPSSLTLAEQEIRSRPDWAHDTMNLGLAQGWFRNNSFQQIRFKFSYHDLLNNDDGYEPFSQMDFPSASARVENGSLHFQDIRLLDITSLYPVSPIDRKLSWRLLIDHRRAQEYCDSCYITRLKTGAGVTVSTWNGKLLAYSYALLNAELSEDIYRGYGLSPELLIALISQPLQRLKAQVAYRLTYNGFPSAFGLRASRIEGHLSFFTSRNTDLRLSLHNYQAHDASTNSFKEILAAFNFYF